ncbi:MAG: dipeptidase [Planctomycetota bacterium]
MSDFAAVAAHLTDRAEANREALFELLRIPSVSTDPAHHGDCRTAAEWVRDFLQNAGCTAELIETGTEERPGQPIILAKTKNIDGAPTLLVYGHYDVQPPDPLDQWTAPPFEPTVREGKVYARGATDDKGQMLTHPLAVAAWHAAAGGPPVNVTFVIEGEEEVGSDHLDAFLEEHKDELACDAAVISDTSQFAEGVPAICYGLRGITACEITVTGPKADLHSGLFGGSVRNPANALASILASLHAEDGRVAVEGFYDDVIPPTPEERAAWAALPFDQSAFLNETGVPAAVTPPGATVLEGQWVWPTCDVNGLTAGYQGPGPKTIIPATATAKVSFRLVPDQTPDDILSKVRQHLRTVCPTGVTVGITPYHGAPGVAFGTDDPAFAAAGRAIEHAFGKAPALIRGGGSIPVVRSFGELLGCPVLLLGWGQETDGLHSPDEHFSLQAFEQGALASARLMWELAQ